MIIYTWSNFPTDMDLFRQRNNYLYSGEIWITPLQSCNQSYHWQEGGSQQCTPPARIRWEQPWLLAGILRCPHRNARGSANQEEASDKPEVGSRFQTNWPQTLTNVKGIKSRRSEEHSHP